MTRTYKGGLPLWCGLALVCSFNNVFSAEFGYSGKVAAELRIFAEEGAFEEQSQDSNLSLALEPEFLWQTDSGQDAFKFTPFFRLDQHDDERTHADVRELSWEHYGEDWDFRAGLRKVFWGVTEFQHLADVINQDDGVEDIDGEDKLGQPMINLSLVRDWGIIDLFILPGFREANFPGEEGRLRTALPVNPDQAQFEDDDEEKHIDYAVRWSHTLGDFDFGLHVFDGTNRDPVFRAALDKGNPVLIPYYEQMTQYGFDLQATIESWLWKAELVHRDSEADEYLASQTGFEYTFYGIGESDTDLGVLLEYGWDERGEDAASVFQNDIAMGARLALNDVNSTEFLAGIIHDLDFEGSSFQIEASRRFAEAWKLNLDVRFFSSDDERDFLSVLDKDSHLQLTVERYF